MPLSLIVALNEGVTRGEGDDDYWCDDWDNHIYGLSNNDYTFGIRNKGYLFGNFINDTFGK